MPSSDQEPATGPESWPAGTPGGASDPPVAARDAVTRLLAEGADAEALLPLVYDDLKRIAQRRMGSERGDHTLQATA